ncbi:unnamed protein product [Protopolystoma xenopodis]|uniref:Uncharacterized protein n=1 Tax=Protopolystoma xenopodis TaxID=117903 RepID=A0A3S5BVE9_9PLAT|nr:unnamed protein product [Protopolystoma xenopodis]
MSGCCQGTDEAPTGRLRRRRSSQGQPSGLDRMRQRIERVRSLLPADLHQFVLPGCVSSVSRSSLASGWTGGQLTTERGAGWPKRLRNGLLCGEEDGEKGQVRRIPSPEASNPLDARLFLSISRRFRRSRDGCHWRRHLMTALSDPELNLKCTLLSLEPWNSSGLTRI